jgi:hypothetical protein
MGRYIQSLLVVLFIFVLLLQLISFITDLRAYAETKYPDYYHRSSERLEVKHASENISTIENSDKLKNNN